GELLKVHLRRFAVARAVVDGGDVHFPRRRWRSFLQFNIAKLHFAVGRPAEAKLDFCLGRFGGNLISACHSGRAVALGDSHRKLSLLNLLSVSIKPEDGRNDAPQRGSDAGGLVMSGEDDVLAFANRHSLEPTAIFRFIPAARKCESISPALVESDA